MTELAAAVLLATGIATHYDPGVMDGTVARRQAWGHIQTGQGEVGYAAMLDRADIGRTVWLLHPNGTVVGPVLIADCGAKKDRRRLQQIGFAVDLSFELAVEFGSVGSPIKNFEVWSAPPVGRDRWLVWDE